VVVRKACRSFENGVDSLRPSGGWATGQGRADWPAGRRKFDSGEVTGEVQRSWRTTGGQLRHVCSAAAAHGVEDGCGAGRMRYRTAASRFNCAYRGVHGTDGRNAVIQPLWC